ncbi:unnamed protein product [Discosporangium mesarthrocarpum]
MFPFREDLLSGKKAIVTGGNRGLGAGCVQALVKAGAEVAVIARNHSKYLDIMRQEGGDISTKTTFFQADLSSSDDTATAAKKALEWAGGCVDILVNNAGVASSAPLGELSLEQWDTTMNVNVRAPFLLTQIVGKAMIERGMGGKIINISSLAGKMGLPNHGAYSPSKAALDSLTRVTSAEWSKHGIQCNSVAPTVVMTEMGVLNWSDPTKSGPLLEKTPLGRFGEVHEISHLVVYLCTRSADLMCGQTLMMEGGISVCIT